MILIGSLMMTCFAKQFRYCRYAIVPANAKFSAICETAVKAFALAVF